MEHKHSRTLILNADFSALSVVAWQKAIVLDFKGQVTNVDFYKDDYILCSSGIKWPIPAVSVLKKYVKRNSMGIPLSKRNAYIRDKMRCAYCDKYLRFDEITYDHVVPRSKWESPDTPTQWSNIVVSCYPCNTKKSNKTLEDAGMVLVKKPDAPHAGQYVIGLAPWHNIPQEWLVYLPKIYLEIQNNKDIGV